MDLILERYKEGSDNVIVDALRLSTYACPFLLSICYGLADLDQFTAATIAVIVCLAFSFSSVLFLTPQCRKHHKRELIILLNECYDASKTGYFNMSILVLLAPQDSLRPALTGWILTIAITICYIIMLYLVDD